MSNFLGQHKDDDYIKGRHTFIVNEESLGSLTPSASIDCVNSKISDLGFDVNSYFEKPPSEKWTHIFGKPQKTMIHKIPNFNEATQSLADEGDTEFSPFATSPPPPRPKTPTLNRNHYFKNNSSDKNFIGMETLNSDENRSQRKIPKDNDYLKSQPLLDSVPFKKSVGHEKKSNNLQTEHLEAIDPLTVNMSELNIDQCPTCEKLFTSNVNQKGLDDKYKILETSPSSSKYYPQNSSKKVLSWGKKYTLSRYSPSTSKTKFESPIHSSFSKSGAHWEKKSTPDYIHSPTGKHRLSVIIHERETPKPKEPVKVTFNKSSLDMEGKVSISDHVPSTSRNPSMKRSTFFLGEHFSPKPHDNNSSPSSKKIIQIGKNDCPSCTPDRCSLRLGLSPLLRNERIFPKPRMYIKLPDKDTPNFDAKSRSGKFISATLQEPVKSILSQKNLHWKEKDSFSENFPSTSKM